MSLNDKTLDAASWLLTWCEDNGEELPGAHVPRNGRWCLEGR